MSQGRVSVCAVVATAGRPDWLTRCLESLSRAAGHEGGIALSARVGVNGGDPASVAAARQGKFAFPVEVESFPKVLPGAARNRLLRDIPAEWVFFIDDDAFVAEDFFTRFLRAVREDPAADVFGGPNLSPPDSSVFQRATGLALSSRFATYVTVARYRRESAARECGEESLILCNLFVRARLLGPSSFAEEMVCAEENALLHDLRRAGGRLVHRPELEVWHERRRHPRELARQVFKYGRGRAQSIRRDVSSLRAAYLVPPAALLAAPALLFAGICCRGFWVPFAVYGALMIAAAFTAPGREALSVRLAAIPLFPLIHLAYGLGVLWGMIQRR